MGRTFGRLLLSSFVLGASAPLLGQAPDQKPLTFEVASIRPNTTHDDRGSVGLPPGRFMGTSLSLRSLLRFAYDLQDFQLVGGPWLNDDRFDIVAKAADAQINAAGQVPTDMLRAMIRTLLADRFKLVAHRETRQLPIYALVVAPGDGRLGPQLHPASVDCAALRLSGQAPPPPRDGIQVCGGQLRPGHVTLNGFALFELAINLSTWVDRVVVDRTGLQGPFNVNLEWAADLRPAHDATDAAHEVTPTDQSGPSLFTAIQEQLGLRLESTKGPVDVLVIDHVERPTPD